MIDGVGPMPLERKVALQVAVRYQLARRVKRAWNMIAHENVKKVLASHHDRRIGRIDIKARDNLDELLAGLAILHIGGFDDRETLATLGLDVEELVELLDHPDVSRYFEATYPFAPPILLRESALGRAGDYAERRSHERTDPAWLRAFERLLLLDAVFNSPGPLEDFLSVLDSYTIKGFGFEDLKRAFRSTEHMNRFLKQATGRRLAEGLEEFLDFSEELDAFLDDCRQFPVFRGLAWLTYGYWYGAGGETMHEVMVWVMSTLGTLADEGPDENVIRLEKNRRLAAMMDRLTDLDCYPAEILRLCEQPLERWSHHVIEQREKDSRRHAPIAKLGF